MSNEVLALLSLVLAQQYFLYPLNLRQYLLKNCVQPLLRLHLR